MRIPTRLVYAIVTTIIWQALAAGIAVYVLPQFGIQVPAPVTVGAVVLLAAMGIFFYRVGTEALSRKPTIGLPSMVGYRARVVAPLAPRGVVRVAGETWEAVTIEGTIRLGEYVVVVGQDGLRLMVGRAGGRGGVPRASTPPAR